ncbi:MAG: hypothetical protein A3C47_03865 [Omnitrophica bacterium RIFCSPHIGHO2_02_FULL_51_18]|nr:MAG: hypothetical protein A3C47_03865 [Omnitrophica bacterium RIFCSPHIGHO2_02_FULL_51_18]
MTKNAKKIFNRRRHQKGFSLLEILVAGTILSIAGAGLYAAFVNAGRYTKPESAVSYQSAQTKLDTVYQTWGEDTWNDTVADNDSTIGLTTYTNRFQTFPVGGKDYKKVEATTSW